MTPAPDLLREAAGLIDQRAASRDLPQERSMRRAVEAYNALTGQTLTETQGWLFMAVLKLSRALGGAFQRDDLLDGAAYMALALEHELQTACEAQEAILPTQGGQSRGSLSSAASAALAAVTQEWLERRANPALP